MRPSRRSRAPIAARPPAARAAAGPRDRRAARSPRRGGRTAAWGAARASARSSRRAPASCAPRRTGSYGSAARSRRRRGGRRGGESSIHLRALRALDEPLDLLVGEAGELARLLGDRDRHHLVVAVLAAAAEVEALVDRLLELDRLAPALGVAARQLVEPAGAHPHVRDLVRQHVVHRLLDDRVADLLRDVDELVEHVAGEALEAAVDAGHACRRVFRAGAAPEDGGLGELAHAPAEMLEQIEVRLDVARLVPDLSRHVQRELPGRVGEVIDRAPRPLHRLELADHDAVHPLADGLAAGQIGERRQPLLDLQLTDLPRAHAHEPILARELVVGDRSIHAWPPRGNEPPFSECSRCADGPQIALTRSVAEYARAPPRGTAAPPATASASCSR